MILRYVWHWLVLSLPLCAFSLAPAQAANARENGLDTKTFADPSLGLSFDYPAQFIPDTSSSPSEATKRCVNVLLSMRAPELAAVQSSMTLLEFKRTCMTDAQWQDHDRVLASLTKALYNQPGAESIGKPLVYDFGGDLSAQRLHMSAARQQVKDARQQTHTVLQMDLATFVHDRAVLWVLQSDSIEGLNRLSKTLVSFDGKRKVPLFPASIQPNASTAPALRP